MKLIFSLGKPTSFIIKINANKYGEKDIHIKMQDSVLISMQYSIKYRIIKTEATAYHQHLLHLSYLAILLQ